jgi:hypothetical protein
MLNIANYNTGVAIANSEVVGLAAFKQILMTCNLTLVYENLTQ